MQLIPIEQDGKTIYKCNCCDTVYQTLPMCFGAATPDLCNIIPLEERETRIEMNKSLCVIDQKYFLHRGFLTIPIIDSTEAMVFDIWTTISEADFEKRMDLWDDPERIKSAPYCGWLNSYIPTYGNTINIKTVAIEQTVGDVPEIVVVEDNHPLTIDQREGITMDKALDIVGQILHMQAANANDL